MPAGARTQPPRLAPTPGWSRYCRTKSTPTERRPSSRALSSWIKNPEEGRSPSRGHGPLPGRVVRSSVSPRRAGPVAEWHGARGIAIPAPRRESRWRGVLAQQLRLPDDDRPGWAEVEVNHRSSIVDAAGRLESPTHSVHRPRGRGLKDVGWAAVPNGSGRNGLSRATQKETRYLEWPFPFLRPGRVGVVGRFALTGERRRLALACTA